MTLGPCPCQSCGVPLYWSSRRWREAGQRSGKHVCREDRPECGAWMRNARERCARRPGHRDCHRTRYSLDAYAHQRRAGWAA